MIRSSHVERLYLIVAHHPPKRHSSRYSLASAERGAPSSLLQKVLDTISESSGESELKILKQQVHAISRTFDDATQQVTQVRAQTAALQTKYEDLQKEHLQLIMRRDSWSEPDIRRFADITSSEMLTKRELDASRLRLKDCEVLQETTKKEYMDTVRKRYHEEQLWQDKWRVISTYGTWALIGINSMVFIISQYLQKHREDERIRRFSQLMEEKFHELASSQPYSSASHDEKTTMMIASSESDPEESKDETKHGSTTTTSPPSSTDADTRKRWQRIKVQGYLQHGTEKITQTYVHSMGFIRNLIQKPWKPKGPLTTNESSSTSPPDGTTEPQSHPQNYHNEQANLLDPYKTVSTRSLQNLHPPSFLLGAVSTLLFTMSLSSRRKDL